MNSLVIDPFEFCRLQESRAGEIPVVELARLARDTASAEGSINWTLTGEIDALGHHRLNLSVSGKVYLRCQRCLTPYAFELDSASVLLLAKDEALADQIQESLDEDEVDVIVASGQLNALDLLEDEALLALPSSPRHEACPEDVLVQVPVQQDKGPSAFDALKNWKR